MRPDECPHCSWAGIWHYCGVHHRLFGRERECDEECGPEDWVMPEERMQGNAEAAAWVEPETLMEGEPRNKMGIQADPPREGIIGEAATSEQAQDVQPQPLAFVTVLIDGKPYAVTGDLVLTPIPEPIET